MHFIYQEVRDRSFHARVAAGNRLRLFKQVCRLSCMRQGLQSGLGILASHKAACAFFASLFVASLRRRARWALGCPNKKQNFYKNSCKMIALETGA